MIIHVRWFINTSPTHRLMIFQESNFYQLPKSGQQIFFHENVTTKAA